MFCLIKEGFVLYYLLQKSYTYYAGGKLDVLYTHPRLSSFNALFLHTQAQRWELPYSKYGGSRQPKRIDLVFASLNEEQS